MVEADIAKAADRVIAALATTLDDPRGRWLLGPQQNARNEYRLSTVIDGVRRELVIDRMFEDLAGAWIVDYKTSSHEGADLEGFLEGERRRYRDQLERYAVAVGREGARRGLYFPLLKGWREWTSKAETNRDAMACNRWRSRGRRFRFRRTWPLLERSPASDWRDLDPENTIYLELPAGRVVIELAAAYAPAHVAAIRKLVRDGYFDGSFVIRSQDNYVVQWARPEDDERAKAMAKVKLKPEFARPMDAKLAFTRLAYPDTYAPEVGFSNGFPVARDPRRGQTWLVHCYGSVGVGRDNAADSGNGSELYAVIGQSPRNLDRNITLAGRVVRGIELFSVMPRGSGDMGFYEKPSEWIPIRSVRMTADLPAGERVNLEALRTDSATFKAHGWNRAPIAARSGSRSPSGASACATCRCRCAKRRARSRSRAPCTGARRSPSAPRLPRCSWSMFAFIDASSLTDTASPVACAGDAAEAGITGSPDTRCTQRVSRAPGCLASSRTSAPSGRSASSFRKPPPRGCRRTCAAGRY